MTSNNQQLDLDAIEAVADAATPGPWGTYQYGGDSLIEIAADIEDTGCGYSARRTIARFDEEPLDNDPAHREWTAEEDWAQVQADAAYIAAMSPEVAKALVAEVRRLRARLWEHERPATEAERNALRQSFTELAAQASEDGDHEGAFSLECQLREREEQWKREDAANQPAVEATAPAADEDQLCNSEFPGDDTFVGQLCERERGHDGDHEHDAAIAGTRHRRRLVWPTAPAARSAAV